MARQSSSQHENGMADSPEVAAAIEARKRALDRQTLMAVIGLVAVAVFINFDAGDHGRMAKGLIDLLPWLVGLSIAIFALNRWLLSIQAKQLRREFGGTGGR